MKNHATRANQPIKYIGLPLYASGLLSCLPVET